MNQKPDDLSVSIFLFSKVYHLAQIIIQKNDLKYYITIIRDNTVSPIYAKYMYADRSYHTFYYSEVYPLKENLFILTYF